jgi:hypothetical protein
MNAILRITEIAVDGSHHDSPTIRVLLENVGKEPIAPGHLIAKRISSEGSAQDATLACIAPIGPGEKAKLSLVLQGSLKSIDFTRYQTSEGEMDVRIAGLLSWWLSPWSLKAA